MIPDFSPRSKELQEKLQKFMDEEIYPNEKVFKQQLDEGGNRWKVVPVMEELKVKARERGLWNMFLPESDEVEPMSNLEDRKSVV